MVLIPCEQGRNEGGKGVIIPRAPIDCGRCRKVLTMSQVLFNTVHLLPKDLRFENGGAKLVSCPGRHLTSLRPCMWGAAAANEQRHVLHLRRRSMKRNLSVHSTQGRHMWEPFVRAYLKSDSFPAFISPFINDTLDFFI